jgi:hypothetical protein
VRELKANIPTDFRFSLIQWEKAKRAGTFKAKTFKIKMPPGGTKSVFFLSHR